jgi:hypothetical protein
VVGSVSDFYEVPRARFGIDMLLDPFETGELSELLARGGPRGAEASEHQSRSADPHPNTDEATSGRPPSADLPLGAVRAPRGTAR